MPNLKTPTASGPPSNPAGDGEEDGGGGEVGGGEEVAGVIANLTVGPDG